MNHHYLHIKNDKILNMIQEKKFWVEKIIFKSLIILKQRK